MRRPVKFDVAPPEGVAEARLELAVWVAGYCGLEEFREELAELARPPRRPLDANRAWDLVISAARRRREDCR